MHRFKIFAASVGIGAALLTFPAWALASLAPVGGIVSVVRPCDTGYLITVVNPWGLGSGNFMWVPGSSRDFLWGPPTMSRWVLGSADIAMPCIFKGVTIGGGLRIQFDGTSPH